MGTSDFGQELLDSGLLQDGGVAGVYHRSFTFERVVRGIEGFISAAARGEVNQQWFFSQLMAGSTLAKSGYLTSFPNLIGSVSSFTGGDSDAVALQEIVDASGDWASSLSPTNLTLCSAACHPLYPLLASETLPLDGQIHEVQAFCFRHEPSDDPARMQSFRQHEFVYVGTPEGALAHRDRWLDRGQMLLTQLGLSVNTVVANDPFFGRAGRLLAAGQREQELKYEITSPISSTVPGAISSANYHQDHFGKSFNLIVNNGSFAHTACIGFGLERITLALLWTHGLNTDQWPRDVLEHLTLA